MIRRILEAIDETFEVEQEPIGPLEPLDSIYTSQPMYHGTSKASWARMRRDGLCCPPAEGVTGYDPEYGWSVWKHVIYDAYMHLLTKEQRTRFNRMVWDGRRVPIDAFSELVSLFFVSPRLSTVDRYEIVLRVDCTKIKYFWTMVDDVLGDESYLFVMPSDCPQAPASAFEDVTKQVKK